MPGVSQFVLGSRTGPGVASAAWGAVKNWWGARGVVGRGAVYGALAGGAWGAVSDDTSVLGGMMMGAGLGAGAGYLSPSVRRAASTFGAWGGAPFGTRMRASARAGYRDLFRRGRATAAMIGDTGRRAYGGFSAFAAQKARTGW